MAEKTLSIKRVFCWTMYNSFKNTPPKDFTTGEIKEIIMGVLPVLKPFLEGYIAIAGKIDDINEELSVKKITEPEAKVKREAVEQEFKAYNKEHSTDVCEIKFGEDAFKTLKAKFDGEMGKRWVMNIEEFGELMAAFEEAAK